MFIIPNSAPRCRPLTWVGTADQDGSWSCTPKAAMRRMPMPPSVESVQMLARMPRAASPAPTTAFAVRPHRRLPVFCTSQSVSQPPKNVPNAPAASTRLASRLDRTSDHPGHPASKSGTRRRALHSIADIVIMTAPRSQMFAQGDHPIPGDRAVRSRPFQRGRPPMRPGRQLPAYGFPPGGDQPALCLVRRRMVGWAATQPGVKCGGPCHSDQGEYDETPPPLDSINEPLRSRARQPRRSASRS